MAFLARGGGGGGVAPLGPFNFILLGGMEANYKLHLIYYIDTNVLLENTPLVQFIRIYIRDSSGVFSVSSLVKISMISLISSLSLNLYLNSLMYDQKIFGFSSKVFGNLRKSSRTFVWPSEQVWKIFGKWSEMFGKSSKTP